MIWRSPSARLGALLRVVQPSAVAVLRCLRMLHGAWRRWLIRTHRTRKESPDAYVLLRMQCAIQGYRVVTFRPILPKPIGC